MSLVIFLRSHREIVRIVRGSWELSTGNSSTCTKRCQCQCMCVYGVEPLVSTVPRENHAFHHNKSVFVLQAITCIVIAYSYVKNSSDYTYIVCNSAYNDIMLTSSKIGVTAWLTILVLCFTFTDRASVVRCLYMELREN